MVKDKAAACMHGVLSTVVSWCMVYGVCSCYMLGKVDRVVYNLLLMKA